VTRDQRPDPDALLRQVQAQEGEKARGRLKVFLGASAGVGKTYAMLSDAHEQKERGIDVAIGYIETHGRKETEALVQGLEFIPLRKIAYRGIFLREFDLDGALSRHPQLLLVDELAHSNAPESRHPKRWQDIEELLDAGINVYTTVNIQHLESLNDVVAQITGVVVRETVPDAFIEHADDIEVVDLPPEELRQRLRDGKVYVPERVDQALDGFFKPGNLTALRELALRRAADRVDLEARSFREGAGVPWATRERVLVCVAPNQLGERVVRAAARIGAAAHAEMFALYVESERQRRRPAADLAHAEEALRMAERLGMETARREGSDIVDEILNFARSRHATLIVVGKPIKNRLHEIVFGSVVDELVRRSGEINVYVLTNAAESIDRERTQLAISAPSGKDYAWAAAGTAAPTLAGLAIYGHLPKENIVALYLMAIAYVGSKTTPIASGASCLLSVAAYDFFFVPPRFNFAVESPQYLPTFGVMLMTALLISSLTLRMRQQAEAASNRERRTAALYELSKQLSRSRGTTEISRVTATMIQNDLSVDASVLLPNDRKRLEVVVPSRSQFEKDLREHSVAQWCFDHGKPAGAGTDTLPGATGTYFALTTDRGVLGVLACSSIYYQQPLDLTQYPLLQTFANSLALALERAVLAKEGQQARLTAESERIRSSLLSSVSHDIRTPLTVIQGAASALVSHHGDPEELARTIMAESERLNRQVRNLLDMTRFESGSVQPNLEWHAPEEIVGDAIRRAESVLTGRKVSADVAPGLTLIKADGQLLEQALTNLLENAARHTPPDTPIDVRAVQEHGSIRFSVLDRGLGVPEHVRPHLFESFAQARQDQEGFGLGLAIASSAMKVQGGEATMTDRPGGGAVFTLSLPMTETPPEVPSG
jgi:two-component system sensor histidine kinase KdpD